MARVLAPLAFVGLLLLAWQGYVVLSDVPSSTLPAPTDVASALRREKSVLLDAALVTAGEIAIGFTAAVLVGLLTGVAISRSRLALRASYPVLVASQMVPVPAIAPLLVLWAGFDLGPKVLVIALVSFFPITVATVDGLRGADGELLRLLDTMGAGRWKRFRIAEFPAALPRIFSGLKTAAALAPIGAVFAEWVGASDGLGYLILVWNNQTATAEMLAAVSVLSVLGLTLFGVVSLLQRVLVPWQRDSPADHRFTSA